MRKAHDDSGVKRVAFNALIEPNIREAFKEKCKLNGIKMNIAVEAFMRQFINDDFVLCYHRNREMNFETSE